MPVDPPIGSLKISEMTPSTDWLVDDVFPCLQDGQNLSSTRDNLLTDLHFETIALRKANSLIGLTGDEDLQGKCGIGREIAFMTQGATVFLANDSAGTAVLAAGNGLAYLESSGIGGVYVEPMSGVTLQSMAGAPLTVTDGSSSIKFDGNGEIEIDSLGGPVFFTDSTFGVDFKAPPGQGMYFTVGANDIISIDSGGTATFLPPSGKTCVLGDVATAFILVSNNAAVLGKSFQFGVATGGTWKFTYNNLNVMALVNSGSLQFTSRGTTDMTFVSTANNIAFTTNAGTVKFATLTPIQALVWLSGLVAGNWTGAPPADHVAAINRLAAAVAGLLGGTIP